MDQRKDLTFCPEDLVFAFTPHNIFDSLNNVGGGGGESQHIF